MTAEYISCIYPCDINIQVGDIIGILMMYSMLRLDNPELRYPCYSRTAPYHAIVPVVYL